MVRKKNPEQTRQQILEITADLIHRHGYKGLRVDEVVKKTGLTKGALYHHFPNKQALGYAVVDELFYVMFMQRWQELRASGEAPLTIISQSFSNPDGDVCQHDLEVGCPLTNLGQEMSFEDEGFRERINKIFEYWAQQIADLLSKGIEQGSVKKDTHPLKTGRFLVSAFQGIQCNSKCSKDLDLFHDNIAILQSLIDQLEA